MKFIILLFLLIVSLNATSIIKVEAQDLLRALAYEENSPYVKLYNWNIGIDNMSPIKWDPNGNNWTPKGFERKGKVYLTNNGKITHNIIDKTKRPGYWELLLLGNKDKIIKATLIPNKVTFENPSIIIDKAYIQKRVICQENDKKRVIAYQIKFPQKVPMWLEENIDINKEKGNKIIYTITYDQKPFCLKNMSNNQSNKMNNEESLKSIFKSSNDLSKNSKYKVTIFEEAGIVIKLKYPKYIKSGEYFKIKAIMINNFATARQGGLTLSFPDIINTKGKILKNNFSSLKGYSYPDKIYNKIDRKTMKTIYFMVEGWQNKKWKYGKAKYFEVALKAPYNLTNLRVNIRGILWIRSKYDTKEIPLDSPIQDQQGFGVIQIFIPIEE